MKKELAKTATRERIMMGLFTLLIAASIPLIFQSSHTGFVTFTSGVILMVILISLIFVIVSLIKLYEIANADDEVVAAEPKEVVVRKVAPYVDIDIANLTTEQLDKIGAEQFEGLLNSEEIALMTPARFGATIFEDENYSLKDLINEQPEGALWVRDEVFITQRTKDSMRKLKMAVTYLSENNLLSVEV